MSRWEKKDAHKPVEYEDAAKSVEEYEFLELQVRFPIQSAGGLPPEFREFLLEKARLSGDELREIAVDFNAEQEAKRRDGRSSASPEELDLERRRKIGAAMFRKLSLALIDARLKGELPKGIESTSTREQIMDSATTLYGVLEGILKHDPPSEEVKRDESLRFGVEVADAYDDVVSTGSGLIREALGLPEEIRERLANEFTLTEEEKGEIVERRTNGRPRSPYAVRAIRNDFANQLVARIAEIAFAEDILRDYAKKDKRLSFHELREGYHLLEKELRRVLNIQNPSLMT